MTSNIDNARKDVDQNLIKLETAMSHLRSKNSQSLQQVQQMKTSVTKIQNQSRPFLVGLGILAGAYFMFRLLRQRHTPPRRFLLELKVPTDAKKIPTLSLVQG